MSNTNSSPLTTDVLLYIRVPQAIRIFGISRAKLYQLMKAKKFTSVSLAETNQSRATRLIDYASLRNYLASLAEVTNKE